MSSLAIKKMANVVIDVSDRIGGDTFVESGTFEGRTTCWAAEHFSDVHTVEIDAQTLVETKLKLQRFDNIQFYEGCSRDVFPQLISGFEDCTPST